MTTTNIQEPAAGLHAAQTKEAARRAAKVLQAQPDPTAGETMVYLETGAGLALSISADSTFIVTGLERSGRKLIHFTAEETQAIYSFWWSICAPGIVEHLPAAIEFVKSKRAQEGNNGND